MEKQFNEIVAYANELKKIKSIQAIAYELELSRTQVYNLLKGTLTRKNGNREFSDTIIQKMYNKVITKIKAVETSTFKTLHTVAKNMKSKSVMACVVGKSGLGKTTAYTDIARTFSNTHYILCDHLDSVEEFMRKIHATLGLKQIDIKGSKKIRKQIIEDIAEFASKSNDIPLLILDDVHHLGSGVYQDLKLLFDKTEGMMSIILAGTPQLEINLKKWAGFDKDNNLKYKPKPMMPELFRRFKGNFYTLQDLSEDDLILTLNHNNITDKTLCKQIARQFIKRNDVEMGMFTDCIAKALQVSKIQNLDITYQLFMSV